jgi:hypothetical protein
MLFFLKCCYADECPEKHHESSNLFGLKRRNQMEARHPRNGKSEQPQEITQKQEKGRLFNRIRGMKADELPSIGKENWGENHYALFVIRCTDARFKRSVPVAGLFFYESSS